MKLVPKLETPDRQEVVAKKQLQYRLIGSLRRIAGLNLYEYDLTTGELKKAYVARTVEIGVDLQPVFHNRTVQHELCLYVQALNEANAMKHVRKHLRACGYNLNRIIKSK